MIKGVECTVIIVGAATIGACTGAGFGALSATCVMPWFGTIAGITGGALIGGMMGFAAGVFGAVVHARDKSC
ncbi:unnamed protein product [Rotaria sp. Silwood2]|nr:unnamed protein product [Rotaria sp. Silwood2]CAF3955919.1 unnamed protein product [Rotaria sp. Silwood2]